MKNTSIYYGESRSPIERFLNAVFIGCARGSAYVIVFLLIAIAAVLIYRAFPAFQAFGLSFLVSEEWDAVRGRYGAFSVIIGTFVSSFIALIIAVPLGVGSAIILTEPITTKFGDFPRAIQESLVVVVELLAAVPSVIYGLWGIFVVIPAIKPFCNWLHVNLGWIPFFSTPSTGTGLFPASLVLAVMILPIITAVSRSSLAAIPPAQRQGAVALGASRWSTLLRVLIPAAFSGIVGGIILALGRALGETMAVTMLIGNSNYSSISIFAPSSTIASLLANQFAEARDLQVSALMYAAFVLFCITLMVNGFAQILVARITKKSQGES